MAQQELYDVIIIGGGPAGLSAAQYAARAKLKTLVLDKSASAGALAYAAKIENYPGLEKPLSGKRLLDIFRKQARGFGAELKEAQVIGVNLHGVVKEVFTLEKNYSSKTVIIATGAMGRKPTIKGEKEFLGRGVSYCAVCDAAFFKGKKVAVVGDSEEAAKEALHLGKFAQEVLLIAPGKKLKVEHDHDVFKSPNIKIIYEKTVVAIEGEEVVQRLRLAGKGAAQEVLELSGVFIYLHGSKPVVDFLAGAVDTSEADCIVTNRMMETTIPGVFAAGDVTCTEVRQVVVAAANGCVAALSAERYIQHRKRRRYDWG
jgi:thioredoxin reductase (NADPH)